MAAGRIAGLDLLRFCAALIVALYHLTVAIDVPSDSGLILAHRAAYPEVFRFAWPGFVGVEIFFVISGVVISYSAMNQSPSRFLRSRALRLFPAIWICLSLSALVCWRLHRFAADELLKRWFGSMLMLPAWGWIDSVGWTLSVEAVFYASVVLVMILLSPRSVYWFGITLGTISMLYLIGGLLFWPQFVVNHLFGWTSLTLLPYGIYFGLGIVLFLRHDNPRLIDVAFCISALIAACIEISLKTVVNHATFDIPQHNNAPAIIFLCAVGFIALSFRLPTHPLVTRWLRVLGLATYPLYLLHDVTGTAVLRWLLDAGLDRFAALGLSLAIVIVLSIAISQWAEPPIRAALVALGSALHRRRRASFA